VISPSTVLPSTTLLGFLLTVTPFGTVTLGLVAVLVVEVLVVEVLFFCGPLPPVALLVFLDLLVLDLSELDLLVLFVTLDATVNPPDNAAPFTTSSPTFLLRDFFLFLSCLL
jgi:hypothetical protein